MNSCPCCQADQSKPVIAIENVPVQNTSLFFNEVDAKNVLKGHLDIQYCEVCGFVFNSRFDRSLALYSEHYEETQGFSPTFQKFQRALVDDLISRYHLTNKRVLELGCGKGEFLGMLCEGGSNEGVGIDPAFRIDRHPDPENPSLEFISEYYRKGDDIQGFDLICCKMTLEHIPNVFEFLTDIGAGLGESRVDVFFQVPNLQRILEETAFWDIYYEHCSYFTKDSLALVFQRAGYRIKEIWTGYDDQYLMISASWHCSQNDLASRPITPSQVATREIEAFSLRLSKIQDGWFRFFQDLKQAEKTVVLWGGGSKAVAFLSFIHASNDVVGVVDVNPNKHGTFLAASGHPILAPADLVELNPDVVIVMNPVYVDEIGDSLKALGLKPTIKTVLNCS